MKIKFSKPILMYHRVDGDFEKSKLSVSPKSLKSHLEFFKKNKKQSVLWDDYFKNGEGYKNQFSITFDDGHESCYREAYPLLLEYQQKATFFIVTDFIGKEGYMTASEIQELANQGFEIGSHTKTHRWLPDLDTEVIREEVSFSKKYLEDLIGKEVKIFSYPLGGLNQEVVDLTKETGYEVACATNPPKGFGWDDPFTLKRIKISRTSDNFLNLWFKMSGYYTHFKDFTK